MNHLTKLLSFATAHKSTLFVGLLSLLILAATTSPVGVTAVDWLSALGDSAVSDFMADPLMNAKRGLSWGRQALKLQRAWKGRKAAARKTKAATPAK